MLYSIQTYGPSLTEHKPPRVGNRLYGDAGQGQMGGGDDEWAVGASSASRIRAKGVWLSNHT